MATLADQALDCMEVSDQSPAIPHALCWTGFILIVGEWILAAAWRSKLINASEAGNRAVIRITQELKPAYRLRWILAWIGTAAAFAATYSSQENTMAAILAILAFELVLASEAASRALFYEARIRHGL
jgi:DMSO reductase anchor subunit